VGALCTYGFYRVIEGNQARREAKREKREVRAALIPFLQAEEDARYVAERERLTEVERRVMRGADPDFVPGASPYKTPGVWLPPGDNRFG